MNFPNKMTIKKLIITKRQLYWRSVKSLGKDGIYSIEEDDSFKVISYGLTRLNNKWKELTYEELIDLTDQYRKDWLRNKNLKKLV